jgi:thiamine biosynthesis protein ThiS
MKLVVNGEPFEYPGEPRLGPVLLAYGVAEVARVAVVLGDTMVPREKQAQWPVHDGDRIEILIFAGGG